MIAVGMRESRWVEVVARLVEERDLGEIRAQTLRSTISAGRDDCPSLLRPNPILEYCVRSL